MDAQQPLNKTPLFELHVSLQGKMVPFAGYAMPVQYSTGVIKEHLHTRSEAGLFDISHMGQIEILGNEDILSQIEKIMPGDFQEMVPGQVRYSFLLNDVGGVIDDLMVTRPSDKNEQNKVYIVANASGRETDLDQIKKQLPHLKSKIIDDMGLIAIQGPKAATVLARFCQAPKILKFMQSGSFMIKDIGLCLISRSGYTGEDGFEISVPNSSLESFFLSLLGQPEVLPIGLGARDSLRLEAGLPLYGHELNLSTSPIEANLTWAIGKRRRLTGGFIGSETIRNQIVKGCTRKLVAIKPEGKALAREQTEIQDLSGKSIGLVSSGGYSPTLEGPVCMGYVETSYAHVGTPIILVVRGNPLPAVVAPLPFVKHRYLKG